MSVVALVVAVGFDGTVSLCPVLTLFKDYATVLIIQGM